MRQTEGRTICRSTQCLQALYKALKQYSEVSSFKFHKKQNKQTEKLTLFCSKRTKLSSSRKERKQNESLFGTQDHLIYGPATQSGLL